MLTTTLNEIRAAGIYRSDWENFLKHLGKTKEDNEPLPVAAVLDFKGISDALWIVANIFGDKSRKLCATFAANCVKRVSPILESIVINADRNGDECAGLASEDATYADRARNACRSAYYAAFCAETDDVYLSAYLAFHTASLAADASLDFDAEREWQVGRLRELIEEAE
jgi:hypothetical protein